VAEVEFRIEPVQGNALPLGTDLGVPGRWRMLSPSIGLGSPAEDPQTARSPIAGSRFLGSRTVERALILRLECNGSSRSDTEAAIRSLDRALHPVGQSMPRLVARYTSGAEWELPFTYESGLEEAYQAWGDRTAEFTVALLCPQPFWVSRSSVPIGPVAPPEESDPLLPPLIELNVSSSTVLGSVQVTNPGDVPVDVAWTITGPGGPTQIMIGGRGWRLNTVLGVGDVVRVERQLGRWVVLDQDGESLRADMDPAPKFPQLPPGTSTVLIEMADGVAGQSSVAGAFNPRRRVVF